jgi:6-phospho-beta-glucosidase
MKISVIGGAGVRTPLLVHGLSDSDLPLTEVALWDTDLPRLDVIGSLARQLSQVPVRICSRMRECIEGADYIFTSIRVGGIEGRARDEATIMRHGVVGQETVGPGGFAMAFRTIPHLVRYAREIAASSPGAWVINFTNPVGIISQALLDETGIKMIGICDTPTELWEEVAHELGHPSEDCRFDYFGLNHLGWLREVYCNGEPQLNRLWERPEKLSKLYRAPLFSQEFLAGLRMLPTEYLYYYYRPHDAFDNIRRSGTSRGAVIQKLNSRLFEDLGQPGADGVGVYKDYLESRNASYMQIESGSTEARPYSSWTELTGYDKIALSVVRAIHFNTGSIIPLNVLNNGNIPFLEDRDVVEVPCVVNRNGALPLNVGSIPDSVKDLIIHVKRYERLTIEAALAGTADLALEALASNPLVPNTATAEALLSDLDLI